MEPPTDLRQTERIVWGDTMITCMEELSLNGKMEDIEVCLQLLRTNSPSSYVQQLIAMNRKAELAIYQ